MIEKPQAIVIGCVLIALALIFAGSSQMNYSYLVNEELNISCVKLTDNYAIASDLDNVTDGYYKYDFGATNSPNVSLTGKMVQTTMVDNIVLQEATTSNGVYSTRFKNSSGNFSVWN